MHPRLMGLIAPELPAVVLLLLLLLVLLWPERLKPTAADWHRAADSASFAWAVAATLGTLVLATGYEVFNRLRGRGEKSDPDLLTPEGPAWLRDRQE